MVSNTNELATEMQLQPRFTEPQSYPCYCDIDGNYDKDLQEVNPDYDVSHDRLVTQRKDLEEFTTRDVNYLMDNDWEITTLSLASFYPNCPKKEDL